MAFRCQAGWPQVLEIDPTYNDLQVVDSGPAAVFGPRLASRLVAGVEGQRSCATEAAAGLRGAHGKGVGGWRERGREGLSLRQKGSERGLKRELIVLLLSVALVRAGLGVSLDHV